MNRLRFSLRQLLVGVVLAAIVLLLARYALRSAAIAAAALAMAVAATVWLAANLLIYSILHSAGQFFGIDAGEKPPSRVTDKLTTEETPCNRAD